MKRLLIVLLLLPSLAFAALPPYPPTLTQIANAEVWVHDGWFYTVIELSKLTGGTEKWCKFIPLSYINSMPDARQKLSVVETPVGSQANIDECNGIRPTPQWVVAPNPVATDTPPTRPLKDGGMSIIGRIAVGLGCELPMVYRVNSTQEYHWATNSAGQRGLTICVKR